LVKTEQSINACELKLTAYRLIKQQHLGLQVRLISSL